MNHFTNFLDGSTIRNNRKSDRMTSEKLIKLLIRNYLINNCDNVTQQHYLILHKTQDEEKIDENFDQVSVIILNLWLWKALVKLIKKFTF